jgi:hypothetical protein
MMRILVLIAVTLTIGACGGSQKRSSDLLYDVRAYNEGVRWVKLPQAAVRILPSEREAFLDERESLEEDLRIDDYEITRLKMHGETQDTADVQIKWTWHMDAQGIVHTTTSKQEWKRYGKRWLMLKEAHVRGDEMPGIPEAVEEPDGEEGEAGEEEADAQAEETQARGENRGKGALAHRKVEAALRAAEKRPRIAE